MSASILIYSAQNGSNICFSQFFFYVLQCKVNKKKVRKEKHKAKTTGSRLIILSKDPGGGRRGG